MGIQRYYMNKDCDITNGYKSGFVYSATLSNDGQADSLQVFSLYNWRAILYAKVYCLAGSLLRESRGCNTVIAPA